MLLTRTSRRYAKVLFNLAQETGRVDNIRRDLIGLQDLRRQSPDLSAFLTNYLVPAVQRLDVLRSLFEGKLTDLTYRFLMVLEEQQRLKQLASITDFFNELYDRERGVLKAIITSARPLTDEQFAALRRKLESRFKKQVAMESKVQPTLLGGFTVQVGDVIYNSSTEHQLEVFKQKLITV
jgi:F-type H+-transporting ATPase subunit delta